MEPNYERNKKRIQECMKQLNEDRIDLKEININESISYVEPIKRKQEEDIQRVRLRMYELRQQHIQVKPIFSFEKDYKRMKEDYERGLKNIYNIKSNKPFK